ncbi:MAG: tetratricopeptide repeat protein [Methylophilus sp.]|nr:tetratricopeptide repeat protein [Methylophilus sp.]
MKNYRIGISILLLSVFSNVLMADEKLDSGIASLQHEWAKANYSTAKDAQEPAFKNLTEQAHQLSEKHGNAPEALIWEGIANAGYAKAKGGLGALKLAEKARDLLLAAEKSNPNALQGSAYTSLGSLYYKVPGWPIGFGDKKKAKAYLEKALQANPNGIDPNYFYADFLSEQGEYKQAIPYYEKALAAPPRAGREDADAGRRAEIEAGLKIAKDK